jgi:hypothetical protein
MRLIDDWKRFARKAWSVRLSLIAALLSGIEVAYGVWIDGKPAVFAGLAFVLSISAAVARIVAQPRMHE